MEFSKSHASCQVEKAFPGCPPGWSRVRRWLQAAWPEALGAWAKVAAVGGGQWVGSRDGNSTWVQGELATSLDVQLQVCTYSLDITLECFCQPTQPLGLGSLFTGEVTLKRGAQSRTKDFSYCLDGVDYLSLLSLSFQSAPSLPPRLTSEVW